MGENKILKSKRKQEKNKSNRDEQLEESKWKGGITRFA